MNHSYSNDNEFNFNCKEDVSDIVITIKSKSSKNTDKDNTDKDNNYDTDFDLNIHFSNFIDTKNTSIEAVPVFDLKIACKMIEYGQNLLQKMLSAKAEYDKALLRSIDNMITMNVTDEPLSNMEDEYFEK